MLKKILKEAFPTMISFTMSGMYSVIDGIFVGNATGDTGLAAINLAWPIPALITALGIGIGTGGSVLYSNYKGRGDNRKCEKIYQITVTMLILTSILCTIFLQYTDQWILKILGARGDVFEEARRYTTIIIYGCFFQILGTGIIPLLRNMNRAVGAMISMCTGFVINTFVNYYLMYCEKMGIQGAAYGTVVAQCFVLIISFFIIWKMEHSKYRVVLERKKIQAIIKIGLAAFGVSLAPTIALMFTNYQCLRYGGDKAVACYAVISYIVFPVQYFLSGLGDGIQPLISYYNGAGRQKEIREIRKCVYILNTALGILFLAITVLCIPYIGKNFGLSDTAKRYFEIGMTISAIAFVFVGITKFNISYSNATLMTKTATALTYIESLLISPICLFIFPVFLGIHGIWISLPCTSIIMIGIYLIQGGTIHEKKI